MKLHFSIVPNWRHRCAMSRGELGEVIEEVTDATWFRCHECGKSVRKLQHGIEGFENISLIDVELNPEDS